MADTVRDDQEPEHIEKKIRYFGADEVVAQFADLAIFSHGTGQFIISFYQVLLPESEGIEAIRELPNIPAKCISRMVVAPDILDQFQSALATNIAKFKEVQARKVPTATG